MRSALRFDGFWIGMLAARSTGRLDLRGGRSYVHSGAARYATCVDGGGIGRGQWTGARALLSRCAHSFHARARASLEPVIQRAGRAFSELAREAALPAQTDELLGAGSGNHEPRRLHAAVLDSSAALKDKRALAPSELREHALQADLTGRRVTVPHLQGPNGRCRAQVSMNGRNHEVSSSSVARTGSAVPSWLACVAGRATTRTWRTTQRHR